MIVPYNLLSGTDSPVHMCPHARRHLCTRMHTRVRAEMHAHTRRKCAHKDICTHTSVARDTVGK